MSKSKRDISTLTPTELDNVEKFTKSTTAAHIVTANILAKLQIKTKDEYAKELRDLTDKSIK